MSTQQTWQKSSYSGTGDDNNCVELAATGPEIRLREGDNPATTLSTHPPQLHAFLIAIRTGRLTPQ